MAGYGLRRQLVDEQGQPKGILERGQRKSLQTDRVVLVPGPAEEIETVRRIYRLFVCEGSNYYRIAKLLNKEGKTNHLGGARRYDLVREILSNDKYIGRHVYNRETTKLKAARPSQQTGGLDHHRRRLCAGGGAQPVRGGARGIEAAG